MNKIISSSQLWQVWESLVCQEQLHVQDFGFRLTKEHCTLLNLQYYSSVSLRQPTEGKTETPFTAKPTCATKTGILWGCKGWGRRNNVDSWVRLLKLTPFFCDSKIKPKCVSLMHKQSTCLPRVNFTRCILKIHVHCFHSHHWGLIHILGW